MGGELAIMNTLYLRAGSNVFLIEGSPFGGGDDVVIEGADDADNTGVGPSYVNPTTITRSDLREGQAIYNLGLGLNYQLPNSGIGFKFDYARSARWTMHTASA